MASITIRIPDELKKNLEILAKTEKRSLSNLIRLILEKGAKPSGKNNT